MLSSKESDFKYSFKKKKKKNDFMVNNTKNYMLNSDAY